MLPPSTASVAVAAPAGEVAARGTTSGPRRSTRDPALDLLRAVALARVVIWHTFAETWMTAFAAIPVMFFVAGSLLGASSAVRSHRALVLRRCRRLLLPLWAYGGLVVAAGAVHAWRAHEALVVSRTSLWRAAAWLFPLTDPSSAAWHGGWLTGHLWYLRVYLWVVLLAPVFVALARRMRIALPAMAGAIVLLQVAPRFHVPLLAAGEVRLLVGDLVTYGVFVVLGIAYQRRPVHLALPRRAMAAGAVAAGAAAVLFAVVVGIPDGNVNESYPAIALTGLAWLLAAGAAEPAIRRLAERGIVRRSMLAINRRAETVYLWHPAAIVVAYALVEHWGPSAFITLVHHQRLVSITALLAVTVALTAVVVTCTGWVEDLGAARLPRRQPGRQGRRLPALIVIGGLALAAAAPLVVVPSTSGETQARAGVAGSVPAGVGGIRPPSFREALTNSAFAAAAKPAESAAAPTPARSPALAPDALRAALTSWAAGQDGLTSVAVAVGSRGAVWTGDADPSGSAAPVHAADVYAVASMTKSFTAALVLREAAAGHIALDAPMPALRGVASVPAGVVITPRQLIQHTSGLVDYSLATGFDQKAMLTPAAAVSLSLRTKLQSAPGAEVHYANSNYLWLGLLLEHVTGHSYADLIAQLAKSQGLPQTSLDPAAIPGWIGFSSGGVHSTVGEMARWEQRLDTPGTILPADLIAGLTTLDAHNVGLGTWPLCPCWTGTDGSKQFTAIGHYVGDGGSYRYPDGMTLVVHIAPESANSEARIASLGADLRAALGAS